MIHKACMPVYMNSGKIVADGTGGKIEGSTRGPRGPNKNMDWLQRLHISDLGSHLIELNSVASCKKKNK